MPKKMLIVQRLVTSISLLILVKTAHLHICSNDLPFIILITTSLSIRSGMKMNHKEMLLEEIFEKVGDKMSKQAVAEKVGQFLKFGNVFLLFEVVSLRGEIEKLREDIQDSKVDDLPSHPIRTRNYTNLKEKTLIK